MAKKNKTQDPYEIELLDLMNEVGGKMVIKYHTAKLTADKNFLLVMRKNGFPTDVLSCIMFGLAADLRDEQKVTAFLQEAAAAGAAPSVTFEAEEDEGLNIKSRKENPLFDILLQAAEKQNKKK